MLARVAKLADARDLKSRGPRGPCGFDSRPGHQCLVGFARRLFFNLNLGFCPCGIVGGIVQPRLRPLFNSGADIVTVHNVVTVEHAAGFVPGNFHGHITTTDMSLRFGIVAFTSGLLFSGHCTFAEGLGY